MAPFPVDEAQIVALFMECIAYGVYLVTLGICIRVLFWDRYQGLKERINWPMVVVAVIMAIFATLDVALGLRHNLEAFIFHTGPGGPIAEFDNISHWVNVMKTADTQVMALIGDAMLIYRCYVIFSHSWFIIIAPILMWFASLACTVMIIYITATLKQDALLSTQHLLKPFLYSFLIITIILNLSTTSAIVWKIWQVDKDSAPHITMTVNNAKKMIPKTRLQHVIRIIIESGMLYTISVIGTFLCVVTGSNAIYGVSCVMVISVGISFNLIIIRVDQANESSSSLVESGHVPTYPLRFIRSGGRVDTVREPMEIMISQDIDRDVSESDKHNSVKSGDMISRTNWNAV